jgi:hypothetical protein
MYGWPCGFVFGSFARLNVTLDPASPIRLRIGFGGQEGLCRASAGNIGLT